MGNSNQAIKNILKFYFEPEILTPEEAEKELKELGVDTEKIENKRNEFLKKLEAKKKLREGQKRKEQFEKLMKEVEAENNPHNEQYEYNFKMAARKQNGKETETQRDENLLKMIKQIRKE